MGNICSLPHEENCNTIDSLRGRQQSSFRTWYLRSKRSSPVKKDRGIDNVDMDDDSPDMQRSTSYSSAAVWQRSIWMGERCEPPCFSGLILYDEHGNPVQQLPPKSPSHPALRLTTVP